MTEWIFFAIVACIAGLCWSLPFLMWFTYKYDMKAERLARGKKDEKGVDNA
jgi:hypothetical protein